MTDDLVARLRGRLAKATSGEWEIVPYGDGDSLVIHSSATERVCFMATPSYRDEQRRRKTWREIKSNAALICDLKTYAPALLDELEALRAENARLREALEPSAWTKASYMGEFSFSVPDFDECGGRTMRHVDVPWNTIKEIMAAVRNRAALAAPPATGKEG